MTLKSIAAVLALAFAWPAFAGEADVVGVTVKQRSAGVYDFLVTVKSNETGWEAFANRFEVLAPDGTVLGTRVLGHPHVAEQPFTRELYGVEIPAGIAQVTVRAHHKPKGYDGETMTVDLPD